MKSKTIIISIVVVLLGIAAAVAGFAAEAKKVKKTQLIVVYYGLEPVCEYPSSPAMGYAIAAVVALVIARAIITLTTGGCCSCCLTIPNLPKFAQACRILSWIISSMAIVLFLSGATLSSKKGVEQEIDGTYYCYTVRPGIFTAAGIMGLLSTLLAVTFYLNYVSAINGVAKTSGKDVELGASPIKDGKNPPIAMGLVSH